jgi:hypothetical protein
MCDEDRYTVVIKLPVPFTSEPTLLLVQKFPTGVIDIEPALGAKEDASVSGRGQSRIPGIAERIGIGGNEPAVGVIAENTGVETKIDKDSAICALDEIIEIGPGQWQPARGAEKRYQQPGAEGDKAED